MRFSAAQRIDPFPGIPGPNCFLADGDLYKELAWTEVAKLAPRDLLASPYVFRFYLPAGRVYFTEDEAAFLRLKDEGKTVRRLHGLFGAWEKDLVRQGLPQGTSIYWWPLGEIRFWLNTFKTLAGSKVVYQGAVGGWKESQPLRE